MFTKKSWTDYNNNNNETEKDPNEGKPAPPPRNPPPQPPTETNTISPLNISNNNNNNNNETSHKHEEAPKTTGRSGFMLGRVRQESSTNMSSTNLTKEPSLQNLPTLSNAPSLSQITPRGTLKKDTIDKILSGEQIVGGAIFIVGSVANLPLTQRGLLLRLPASFHGGRLDESLVRQTGTDELIEGEILTYTSEFYEEKLKMFDLMYCAPTICQRAMVDIYDHAKMGLKREAAVYSLPRITIDDQGQQIPTPKVKMIIRIPWEEYLKEQERKAKREQKERERREKKEKEDRERKEKEEKEQAERERKAKEKREREEKEEEKKERLAKEKKEKEEREAAERDRLAKEKKEADDRERERKEKERKEKEERDQIERERLAKEKKEADERERERKEKERKEKEERDQAERERKAKEKKEKEERDQIERERLAKEKKEKEERDQIERERLAKEKKEADDRERERKEKERKEKEERDREELEKKEGCLYFAYGAQLDDKRLCEALKLTYLKKFPARKKNWKLVFNCISKKSKSGMANITPQAGNTVYGIAYLIPSQKMLPTIDSIEGVEYHRENLALPIELLDPTDFNKVTKSTTAYIYTSIYVKSDLSPSKAYINSMLASKDLLPPEFSDELTGLPTFD